MAVVDYDRVTAITREKILPKLVDQIVKDHPILSRLLSKAEKATGGHRIEQPVRYANSTQGGWLNL